VSFEAQSGSGTFIQALALGLDPAWRRLSDAERRADAEQFAATERAAGDHGVRSLVYSSVSLQPGVDLLIWRTAPSVDALEAAGAALLRSGLGRSLVVRHSLIGRIGPSQYVRKPTEQEQSAFAGEGRYLVVYPFTKSTAWHLTPAAERQKVMNEHMKIGHQYPSIRQALAYSFGLDDQDFVVAYEMDDLAAFGDLVRALRGSESRRETVSDTPILLGVHRPLDEILGLLGAPGAGSRE
jgi:chlorite dismutase